MCGQRAKNLAPVRPTAAQQGDGLRLAFDEDAGHHADKEQHQPQYLEQQENDDYLNADDATLIVRDHRQCAVHVRKFHAGQTAQLIAQL